MTEASKARSGASLTVGEVAVRLNVSNHAVRRLITHGHIKRMRGFNHGWRVAAGELDRYTREQVTA